ncbi:L-amino-acid oxidase [Dissostichus eleginoides]|uniref:L-amino-acid oxidase n=1 Tax=Dissostichus eleginoides TaxID=100907 RepID=A0AAD9BUA2_DISEL|nr:L-amino-acid oxidase [Dissostichus eleginoides]
MEDVNTFFLVNGLRRRTYAVKANPNILKYKVWKSEKGKSANQLLQRALQKVKDEVEAHGCKAALQKYDHYSVKEYLKREGGVSPEAIRMIGDLLNEQSLMHLALTEMIYIESDVSDSTTYYEVTGGSDLLTKAFLTVLDVPILLNSKVKRIRQSDRGVIVSYQTDRELPLTDLHADVVLVTTTAKAALFMDFDPPLSIKKMEVLRASCSEVKQVHFAGEHTAFPHAWIETAMKSAIRAATNINKEAARTQQHDEL